MDRRRFLGLSTAGVALATVDTTEVVRRFWQGWRPSSPPSATIVLAPISGSFASRSTVPVSIGHRDARYVTMGASQALRTGEIVELFESSDGYEVRRYSGTSADLYGIVCDSGRDGYATVRAYPAGPERRRDTRMYTP